MGRNDNTKVAYTTSLNPELVKHFRIYCKIKGVKQNEVIEELIQELLDKEPSLKDIIGQLMQKEGEGVGDTDK